MRYAAAILAMGVAAAPCFAAADAFAAYRWERRLLVFFAPSADDAAVARQRNGIARRRQGFDERDLLFISVLGDEAVGEDGATFDAAALRARYRLDRTDVAAILIGKDGGEKSRRVGGPMAMDALFAEIDRMPMRRREMELRN